MLESTETYDRGTVWCRDEDRWAPGLSIGRAKTLCGDRYMVVTLQISETERHLKAGMGLGVDLIQPLSISNINNIVNTL